MNIFIHDEFKPEVNAMLQAMYSRSADTVSQRISKVLAQGPEAFMESYYVGYGHQSIGDCGTTTLYIEDISILADKAIQDNPLYSGQETSTRYINFDQRKIINPVITIETDAILNGWMEFYKTARKGVVNHLVEQHPLEEGQKMGTWRKAIEARSFDILRGFLPAGMTTQLSWSTNLRQAHDNIMRLKSHPLLEVQQVASEMHELLKKKYPSSFSHQIKPEVAEYWMEDSFRTHYNTVSYPQDFQARSTIQWSDMDAHDLRALRHRPKGAELPRRFMQYGHVRAEFPLDYGSFRDLQRHRNGYCPIPLLTQQLGFNDWYIEQLPEDMQDYCRIFLKGQFSLINKLRNQKVLDRYQEQYFLPLGMKVPVEIMYDLPQILYVIELRCSPFVHPTMRKVALEMYEFMRDEWSKMAIHADLSPNPFDIRRGEQDIVEK